VRPFRPLTFALSALGASLAHGIAFGEPVARDPIAAEALFETGKRLLNADDWKGACEKFEKSWELDPAVGTLLKIAKCHEHEGKLATAWYDYRRAESFNREKVEQSPARRRELDDFIRAEVKELEARLPRLTITAHEPPTDLTLCRDGQLISLAVLGEALPVDPGKHEVTAEAPGHVSERHAVNLSEGEAKVVTLTLARATAQPLSSENPPAAKSVVAEPAPRRPVASVLAPDRAEQRTATSGSGQRAIGLLLGGAGVVGLGVGGYFGLRTLSLVRESDPYCQHPGGTCDEPGLRLRERAGRAQTSGIIAASVSGAALVAGAFVVVTAPGKEETVALRIAPTNLTGYVLW
jgi:hypothetical protein